MRTKACLMTSVSLGVLLLGTAVSAKPVFMKQYAAYYKGSAPKCTTCHSAPAKLNAYGQALKGVLKSGKTLTPAMFKACKAKAPKS